jgi:hypothetical protein
VYNATEGSEEAGSPEADEVPRIVKCAEMKKPWVFQGFFVVRRVAGLQDLLFLLPQLPTVMPKSNKAIEVRPRLLQFKNVASLPKAVRRRRWGWEG